MKTAATKSLILSPQQEKELEKYQKGLVDVTRDLKQVRKNLRRETDALEFWTKVVNIAAMPIAVALSGLVLAGRSRAAVRLGPAPLGSETASFASTRKNGRPKRNPW